ncbi:hypothetical protein GDO86_006924 [Hymenochirus boettgeri]|uniref:Tetraspanin n=1 Tax=Hymenochirus boettgeri TaxID=247094 RepID=A0A8T2JAJ4_9PIPI|nr:hypothetical protein GDO86_006924 [Hymenochirus boettgeri]
MGCFSFPKNDDIGGVAVLGIGIWVKVDGGSFVSILGSAAPQLMQVVNVGYLCIAGRGFLMLMGFLGCCGAMKESRCMLMLTEERCGISYVLFSQSRIFIEYLSSMAIKYLQKDYGENNELTAIWNTTMKEFKCCGFNGYTDFDNSKYFEKNEQYPPVCCDSHTPCNMDNISPDVKGCLSAFEQFFNRNGKIVGGVALGICALELVAMIVSLVLFCHIGNHS